MSSAEHIKLSSVEHIKLYYPEYVINQQQSTFSRTQNAFTGAHEKYSNAETVAFYSQLRMERVARDVYNTLQQEPLRDGFYHPAESILVQAFAVQPKAAADWFCKYLSQRPTSSTSAEILRLLSRFTPYTPEWRRNIVEVALLSTSAEVRDAAMQAVESWADPALVSVLRAHSESERWLAKYAEQIVRDLEG
jgi:hypothetical protein